MNDDTVKEIIYLADILEKCDFTLFWSRVAQNPQFFKNITGFYDSIRKFVCHVVGITFQSIEKEYLVRLLGDVDGKNAVIWLYLKIIFNVKLFPDNILRAWIKKYGWKEDGQYVTVAMQEGNIKTKHITEKIDFENLAPLMANCL